MLQEPQHTYTSVNGEAPFVFIANLLNSMKKSYSSFIFAFSLSRLSSISKRTSIDSGEMILFPIFDQSRENVCGAVRLQYKRHFWAVGRPSHSAWPMASDDSPTNSNMSILPSPEMSNSENSRFTLKNLLPDMFWEGGDSRYAELSCRTCSGRWAGRCVGVKHEHEFVGKKCHECLPTVG